ncbi:MAG: hypothetical protein FWC62_00105 [Firmicutes bacterium]|nr:hypothetical protein [Bacillota bacterium]
MFFHNVKDEASRLALQGKPGFQEIAFTAESGKTYHGLLYRATEGPAPLLLYFGGNYEVSYRNMRTWEETGQWPYFDGYSYLCVDYEGYGLNTGRAGYENMYAEALAVYDYARALPDVEQGRVVAMGYSLGTGPAVYLAANRQLAGLLLAAPYASGDDLYNNQLPIFIGPLKLLERQKFPSDQYAPFVMCPTLIIASRGDEMVPFASSERLASLLSGAADFFPLENVAHNDIFAAPGVMEKVRGFLEGIREK